MQSGIKKAIRNSLTYSDYRNKAVSYYKLKIKNVMENKKLFVAGQKHSHMECIFR